MLLTNSVSLSLLIDEQFCYHLNLMINEEILNVRAISNVCEIGVVPIL